MLDVLEGRPARYAVNAPLLSAEAEQTIGPYLPLAETLGRFLAQFARGGVATFSVELAGDLARTESGPLTAAALRGLLETGTTERVNLVNAAILAKARGIAVVERKTPDAGGFSASITVSGSVRGGHVTVGGALAGGEMRLVRLNDYRLDMAAADMMLITRHRDRPGTIGRIGQLLGAADVNISAMHLARSAPRADALMILSVDDEVSPDLEAALRGRGRARPVDDPPRPAAMSEPPTRRDGAHPRRPRRGPRIRPTRRVRVGREGPVPGPG